MMHRYLQADLMLATAVLLLRSAVGPAQCPAPGAPTITIFSNLPTAKGQTYILGWSASAGLDASGSYTVERSPDSGFGSGLETFRVGVTNASLKSDATGTFYHRVRGVASCGTAGPPSAAMQITIVDGAPVVIFTSQPPATVRTAGDPPSSATFDVKNIGGQDFNGYLSQIGTNFFLPSDAGIIQLAPGKSKTFTVEFYTDIVNSPGAYQGLFTIQSTSGAQPKAYPWALVNLTVAPRAARPIPLAQRLADEALAPIFSTDFVSLQATGVSKDPPPVTLTVKNPRSAEMALAAETGPDGWLVPDGQWNQTPLKAGETRTITLQARRAQGESGGIYPRYAFLTVRTKDGRSARVQVQDLDDTSGGPCTTRPSLAATDTSFIVPSVVTADFVKNGRRVVFTSRLLVTNVGVDAVTADIYFTPDGGDAQLIDGTDCTRVLEATVSIPGADVLSLTDPLGKLFDIKPNVSGSLEVRSNRIAQLRVDSVVDSPAPSGGVYGFQLPVMKRGTGATVNNDHFLSGLISDDTYRTNIILTETSGKPATFLLTVHDASGAILHRATKALPAYAKTQLDGDSTIFMGKTVPTASATLSVLDGSGAVIALATMVDRVSQDASTVVSRPQSTSLSTRPLPGRSPAAAPSYRFVVPTVVSGYNSRPGAVPPKPYSSAFTMTNGSATPATAVLTYIPSGGAALTSDSVVVRGRQSLKYDNVLKEVFKIDGDTTGSLFIDADRPVLVLSSRVYSKTDDGSTFGDSIPVYPVTTTAATSSATRRQLLVDGLEQSIDPSRGARTNVVLTEIAGKAGQVEVRLFEKGKERSGPIGSRVYSLAAYEKKQINNVFTDLGADQKDRTNVYADVTALPGSEGNTVALGTRIDNQTSDFKVLVFLPVGESQGGISIGF